MLEYLEDKNVTCGKILRHEASGSDKANRIWTYRNDLGEEFLAGSKSQCRREAIKDLRLCRVDLIVEYTAVGGIHRFDYSDTFQKQNINDLADRLKRARGREAWFEKLYGESCAENRELKAKLAQAQVRLEKIAAADTQAWALRALADIKGESDE